MKGVVLITLLCGACAVPPASDRDVRLARNESDHRALMAQLDDLQARLLVGAERVRFWEEMGERHQSVSAIAVTSLEAHATAMALYLERDQEKSRRIPARLRQARVASVRATAADEGTGTADQH